MCDPFLLINNSCLNLKTKCAKVSDMFVWKASTEAIRLRCWNEACVTAQPVSKPATDRNWPWDKIAIVIPAKERNIAPKHAMFVFKLLKGPVLHVVSRLTTTKHVPVWPRWFSSDVLPFFRTIDVRPSEYLEKRVNESLVLGRILESQRGFYPVPRSEVARHNKPHDCWIAINKVLVEGEVLPTTPILYTP